MRRFMIIALALLLASTASAATVDGLKIHSTSAGSGTTTLVFVHGWTCDLSSWAAQVPALAKKYRVLALDLPGHGKSDSPKDGKFSMDLFARAVEAVRAEAGTDKIVLVGHSMGAPVIRQYAHLYPQHVAGLVAVDGPLDIRVFPTELPPGFAQSFTGPEGRAAREGMIRSMFIAETPPALQEKILAMMLAAPEATAVGAMNAMFDPAIRWSDVIKSPALTVYAGTANVPDPAATKELYPLHEATQVKGTGHFLMMEKPDEFNRLLAGFLAKIHF